jgi:hypothetical protein
MSISMTPMRWLQPGARVGRRGPSRFNGFPAGLGGTGYQPVPLGNLPNGMPSAREPSERLPIFQRHRRSESQRDSVTQPRVAESARLPWERDAKPNSTPTGLCQSVVARVCHNPVGVVEPFFHAPRVARASQPCAEGRNPLGIETECADSSRAQFALQHGNEDLLPAFLLPGNGLRGVEPLFQAKPGGGFLNAQHAPAIGEFQQEQFDAAFHGWSVGSEAEFCQHLIERGRRGDAASGVSGLGGALEITFVEIQHARRWIFRRQRRGFEHLVIQRDGQLMFVQVRAQVDVKARAANYRESRGRALNRIEQRLGRELGLDQSETTTQSKILEWSKVEHGRDCVGEPSGFKKFQWLQPGACVGGFLPCGSARTKLCAMTN